MCWRVLSEYISTVLYCGYWEVYWDLEEFFGENFFRVGRPLPIYTIIGNLKPSRGTAPPYKVVASLLYIYDDGGGWHA